jgi:hypothetical protein
MSGNHDDELRKADGSTFYRRTENVIADKTTELYPGCLSVACQG